MPGLRREELARLAGVSVDYYVRLEQGRNGKVSLQVLNAIADALQLSVTERHHLHALVHTEAASSKPPAQQVRPGLQRILNTFDNAPAYVVCRRLQILAWNHLARILIADFPSLPEEQRNLARLTFLDGSSRHRYVNWHRKADDTVAFLRVAAGKHPDDQELTRLIHELSARSEDFRAMWADHTIRDETHGRKPLYHPLTGPLELEFETFRIPDDPDQALTVYTAEPSSPTADALKRLATTPDAETWA